MHWAVPLIGLLIIGRAIVLFCCVVFCLCVRVFSLTLRAQDSGFN